MTLELSATNLQTPKIDIVRPDREPVAQQPDAREILDQAIEARRKQFVEAIARQSGVERGKLIIEKDAETGKYIHSLVDPESGEVVRQWPDEDWLNFVKSMEVQQGLMFDQKI
jgi:flagellar protein FlaG